MTKKLYCYVDETGQDTEGDIFIVSVVVPKDRDTLLSYLEQVEIRSGKGKFKWGRARPVKRLSYLKTVLSQKKFPFKIYYSLYKNTKEYKTLTILTIAKTVQSIPVYKQYKFMIYVDGLGEKDQRFYGAQLHQLNIPSRRIKGIKRDESNALIRFADSMCGFLRDLTESKGKDKELQSLYKVAVKNSLLIKI
ncbi:hypothetical protein C4579_03575 [Candidatus Microgenomates bacterium]|nr:MAG: hypothetical protein C4579_03575 [Candidatus Microgenomates bacterium]